MVQNLFNGNYEDAKPLALKLRPETLEDFVGQEKIVGKDGILRKLLQKKRLSNSIFYGPPGVGKTTLAEIIAKEIGFQFESLNATTAGVNELKGVVERAKKNLEYYQKKTILFLDEIHRFNKLQQDALLSSTESGVIILIGATTENPFYNLNNALLSRVIVFEFQTLKDDDIREVLKRGCKIIGLEIAEDVTEAIVEISKGDSRIALNYLELYYNLGEEIAGNQILNVFKERRTSFHKEEDKYNIISAMIKSIRGSDPDSAIYWMGRLLFGGEDPRYIARRLQILASEDIGMANPEAMLIAGNAMSASEKIGMPEIRIILAQTVIYLAISSKSNSCYNAINSVLKDIEDGDSEKVPAHIDSVAKNYLYPHDYNGNFVKQRYREKVKNYYIPGDNRNEKLIKEKLEKLWKQ
ncbi:MAG: replication-associated recombination protein A [Fusobacteriaceae bacterium]